MLSNEQHLEYLDHAYKTRDVITSHMMRGLPHHKGAHSEAKPSKLELMRADYQKKLMKEKEEKMIQLYEDNQRKLMMRMAVSENGNNHPRKTKEFPGQKEWSGRGDSGTSLKTQKSSAGRDRSQLLAPIRRPPDTQDVTSIVKSGIPQRLSATTTGNGDGNPFLGRPQLVKHKPLPPTKTNSLDNKMSGDQKAMKTSYQKSKLVSQKYPQNIQQTQQRSTADDKSSVDLKDERLHSGTQVKLTDFQKWQVEQAEAREGRLKKVNETKMVSNDNNEDWRMFDDVTAREDPNSAAQTDMRDDRPRSNIRDKQQDDITSKEKELMEKIAQRQRELDKIRLERHEHEEQEKLELERQKKKETAERNRQKKMNEERKREEVKSMKHEENIYQLEREKGEKQRQEEERMKIVKEKRMKEEGKRRQQEEKVVWKRQRQNGRASSTRENNLSARSRDSRDNSSENDEDTSSTKPSASVPKISGDPQRSKSKTDCTDPDERRLSLSDANVYEKAAVSDEAQGAIRDLAKCQICGRSFVKDRLRKHQDACVKANKPRKEFDSAKKRVQGTELAKYAGKAKRSEPPKKKSNWRVKHEEFIQSLRYAKKVTQCEKEGGDLKKLTPPPASKNPDYVACPHCGRSFNESAAERHIPRCQSLKTRPLPMNTRRK